ncbi:hypothetical protein [Streptomyces sp. NPDC058279]|uniref:hypothetical protein n=1 Tax=Streptomyces sp. NPDC058279 TaxID=3346418 RepID=UPI0036E57ADD
MTEQRRPLGIGPRLTPAPDGPVRRGRLAAELAAPDPAVPPTAETVPQADVSPGRRVLGDGGSAHG